MTVRNILSAVLAAAFWPAAQALAEEADTLRTQQLDEVIIIAAPKETKALRDLPAASNRLTRQDMQAKQVTGIKSLSSVTPNLFIPDYGSRLTTAVYIRGVGSRINTPAVGLYVDNIPYIEKSAFDFNFSDIEQIEVLRGPQSMLYGRNTMGGLIKVQTKSPFTYQGTDVRMGGATNGDADVSLTHYHRISPRFAFSAGGFYEHDGGFFENECKKGHMDSGNAGGGRLHALVLPQDNLKFDINLSYEYNDQGTYPYAYTGRVDGEERYPDLIDRIAYNDESGYRRGMLNGGLNVEYQAKAFIASFITGYQHLNDRMTMDQDFSPRDIFTLTQAQRSNTVSEEIVLKSKPGGRWQWTTGAFGFRQWLRTSAPVLLKRGGIEQLIEDNANNAFPSSPNAPQMNLTVHNDQLAIPGHFSTPLTSLAVYHQSTWNCPWLEGLSLTAGLRLDYEKLRLAYDSWSEPMDFGFAFRMGPMQLEDNAMKTAATLRGELGHDYVQLLPKASIQYEWAEGNNIYVTAAKGYRSGGYNIQMFSDLVQSGLQGTMKQAMTASESLAPIASMIEQMMPATEVDVAGSARYLPEYTWSYEAGTHLTLWDGRLKADAAAFLMNTRDQQVSQFAANGMGRVTRNAGRSRSLGAEASFTLRATEALTFETAYGYTYATFRDYRMAASGSTEEVDYRGRCVPFIPRHTLDAGAQYVFTLKPGQLLDRIRLNIRYNAAGRIYWTEDNRASQPFYGTLNARVDFEKGRGAVSLWARNLLDKDYTSFYFVTMGNGFRQSGTPVQAGIELRCRF